MSTKAQAILDEIRALPPQEFQAVWQQIQRWGSSRRADTAADDPIRSARGMFAGIRHGFVYERVPHITLKSIANNAEIDVIWDQWQAKLEPLRESLNKALKKTWQEWEIPRELSDVGRVPHTH